MPVEATKLYTPEEYLQPEISSEERHQYIDGQIILMTGGTPNHNRIILSLRAMLHFALKRQPYDVFVSNQRLWIPEKRIYTYPDLMVVQGDLQRQEGRKDTITNPVMIAEVLSQSTQGYDRGKKFPAYRTITTLKEYVLIDQYSLYVEQFYRTENERWILAEYTDPESQLRFHSLPGGVDLVDLYDQVVFDADDSEV